MLSYALRILQEETTLQIDIGRQRDPKDSWREETHRNLCTHRETLLRCLHSHRLVWTQKLLRREAFAQRSLCTQKPFQTVTHRSSCTKKSLYGELQYIDAFTHRNFYTEKPLQRELVDTKAFTHIEIFIYRRAFTPRNFHPKKLFNFTDWSHKQKLLHGKAFAQRRLG